MKFSYKAKAADGTLVTGAMVASDKQDAIKKIKALQQTPIVLTPERGVALSFSIPFLTGVKLSEKIIFTKNLSGMLKAGLSLYRALQVLEKQTTNIYFKGIITSLIATIDRGGTLSEGMSKHPGVFSSLFIAMMRAGEESGKQSEVLTQVGTQLEKSYALNKKIKSALMYPAIIVCAIVLIAILMFIYVIPTLTKTFTELGVDLPLSTRIIIGISNFISGHTLIFLASVAAVVGAGVFFAKSKITKPYVDFLVIRLPIMGSIVREMNAARTARTLSSLLASGVDISRSINITKDVLQNMYYKQVLDKVLVVIERGEPISHVFQTETKLYPLMVGEMIEVGEETGKLGDMLTEIAIFYEGEVETKTKDLSTVIEPLLMLVIGAAVGFFAVSMLTPMYSVMDAIK